MYLQVEEAKQVQASSYQPPPRDQRFCKETSETPANLDGAVEGTAVEKPAKNAAQFCLEHVEEKLKLYCEPGNSSLSSS